MSAIKSLSENTQLPIKFFLMLFTLTSGGIASAAVLWYKVQTHDVNIGEVRAEQKSVHESVSSMKTDIAVIKTNVEIIMNSVRSRRRHDAD